MTSNNDQTIPDQKYEVTPLELFFDLVFVFGVSQLSLYLFTHLSWSGAVEMLIILVTIFAVWFTTSWSATMIQAKQSKTQGLILGVMVLGLFMNASITTAFTSSGWAFVIPLLLIQVGRTVWTYVNSPNDVLRDHYFRNFLWVISTTPLWIVGAIVNVEARLLLWALAAGIDQIGRWLAHPIPGRRLQSKNVEFDAGHMLERCRLFLLIALGETVLTAGTAISHAPITIISLLTGTFALLGIIALWALSFGRSHHLILQHSEKTSDPIRTSRYAVYALMVMVTGLIAMAVANEVVIGNIYGNVSFKLRLLLVGGPIIFLIAQGWYLRVVVDFKSNLRVIGVVALLFVGIITLAVPSYIALILVSTSLTILALLDQR